MKICCHPECKVQIGRGHIACIDHWTQLPKEKQAECQRRLHGWKDGEMAARCFAADFFKAKGAL